MKVGLIGLGLMGNPMAKNILKKGFELTVYNRTLEKAEEFKSLGAKVASSPSQVAQNADVIITIVTGPADVEEVLLGANGVALSAKPGTVVVDMSTIGPTAAKKMYADCLKHNVKFVDAPVTGSTPKAISGELTIFVGGEKQDYDKVLPVLQAMGTTVHHLGPSGSGQAVKLINNLLVASTVTALAEGFLLADAQGLPREKLVEALEDVPAVSPFMKMKMQNMLKDDYSVLFSVANLQKDLDLAVAESTGKSQELTILKQVNEYYKQGKEQGLGDLDISAILKVLENQ
jgi:3-hydroxyisobutyrate dehydrogenase